MTVRNNTLFRRSLMKRNRFFLIVIIGIIIIGCSTAYKTLTVKMPDLAPIADGTYRGNCDLKGTPVNVTLDVIVQNSKITKIEIVKHVCSPFGKKAEKIIDKVIENQSLDVDVVSGATGSSKAILKAVENALQ